MGFWNEELKNYVILMRKEFGEDELLLEKKPKCCQKMGGLFWQIRGMYPLAKMTFQKLK